METKNICTILTADDLRKENIKTTVKTMEHNPNKFYLLDANWKTDLCYVIEELSEVSEDTTLLTKTRIAYDLNFSLQTVLKIGNSMSAQEEEVKTEVKTLSELLELLDFNENLILNREDYHVVVDDEGIEVSDGNDDASRTVAKIFQQVIFLNLNLDVQKKSEIKKSLIKDRFRKNYPELLKEVKDNKNFIESTVTNANLNPESKERAEKIVKSFNIMLAEFEKAKSRPIRIAAMGTKKAGKSVVINSLLKRDYAPTSSTLPTPNTIKYIPAEPDSPIILEYEGKEYKFHTDKEISNFIGDEFKRAQKITGEGAGLQDMIIRYPCDDLNGYEIWDTPGPNVAFTKEHRANAEACIKEVDVCIFVMNYSNHLTNDEVNFLKDIHSAFKENNKFYSLFITVNRIDERYAVAEEKSVNRILDYIGGRLEKLDPPYKNIVIFGTSALQSFYLDGVIDLVKADRQEDGEDENSPIKKSLLDSKKFKKRHKDELTQIKFIYDSLGNLEDFHDIDEPTEKELYALSGVPQLLKYTRYIGESKADMEIVNSVIGKCETEFAIVNNALIVTDLLNLAEQDRQRLRELAELVEGLKRKVDEVIFFYVTPQIDDKQVKSVQLDVIQNVKRHKRQAIDSALARSQNILDDSDIDEQDVKLTAQNQSSERIKKLNANIGKMVFLANEDSAKNLDYFKNQECKLYGNAVQTAMQKAQNEILQETGKVKAKVENTAAGKILAEFKVPEFPPSLQSLMAKIQKFDANIDSETLSELANEASSVKYETKYKTETRTKYKTERRERKSKGLWEGFRSFFGKKYYEDVEVPYQEEFQVPYTVSYEVQDTEKFKKSIYREIRDRITGVIESAHDEMEFLLNKEIAEVFHDITEQCENISEDYRKLFVSFKNDIELASDKTNKHRQALEQDIKTFNEMKAHLQNFFSMWNEIIYNKAEK